MKDIPVTWAAVKTAQAEAIAARDDALAAKDAQIAALRLENTKLGRAVNAALSGEEGDHAAIRIENAALREALLPFANSVDDLGKHKGGTLAASYLPDFIKARAIYRAALEMSGGVL